MHGLAVRPTAGWDRLITSAGHPDDVPLAGEPGPATRRAAARHEAAVCGDVAAPGDTAAGVAAVRVERASAGRRDAG